MGFVEQLFRVHSLKDKWGIALFKLRRKIGHAKHQMNYVSNDTFEANVSKSGMIVLYNEYKKHCL